MSRNGHVIHLISDYIDGCLPLLTTRRVAAHIESCADCAAELAEWRAVLQLVARHASQRCPIDCVEVVSERIRANPLPQRSSAAAWMFDRGSFVLATVATVALLAGGLSWLRASRDPLPSLPPVIASAPQVAPGTAPPVTSQPPERLDGAFGRNDSLILASDFSAGEQ